LVEWADLLHQDNNAASSFPFPIPDVFTIPETRKPSSAKFCLFFSWRSRYWWVML